MSLACFWDKIGYGLPVNRFQFSKTDDSSLEVGGDVNFEFREQAKILFSYFSDEVNFLVVQNFPPEMLDEFVQLVFIVLGINASIDRIRNS